MRNFLLLREKALANALLLFEYWKLKYTKINEEEYDFINPTRDDKNFGACRFNIKKGLGADFTGSSFTSNDFKQIGMGFSREDFNSVANGKPISVGFDIIGLVQRLYSCDTYKQAAELLDKQLESLSKQTQLAQVDLHSAIKRQQEASDENQKRIKIARKTWDVCLPIHGTIGETYLNSRMIYLEQKEPQMRFHPKIWNTEVKKLLPCLLLKCSKDIEANLLAIHRIYLDQSGRKAEGLVNKKLALGNTKSLGIWFGSTNIPLNTSLKANRETLCIVEGPENALTIRTLGYDFVVSTINASNFANIIIPDTVKEIILFPDGDEAGKRAAEKASYVYSKIISKIKVIFPPKNPDNPKWDWNDELQLRGKNVRGRQEG